MFEWVAQSVEVPLVELCRVSQKKQNKQIFSTLRAKSVICFYILRSSTEENDTKIIIGHKYQA